MSEPEEVTDLKIAIKSNQSSDMGELLALYKLQQEIDKNKITDLTEVYVYITKEYEKLYKFLENNQYTSIIGRDGKEYPIFETSNS